MMHLIDKKEQFYNHQYHNHILFYLLSLRGLRVFIKICLYASSTGSFLTDFKLLKLIDPLVLPISYLRGNVFKGVGVCFSTTIVANIFFISSVFFNISTYLLLLYYSNVVHLFSSYRLRYYSFQQLSFAISINSLRYPFSRRIFLAQFYRIQTLFFYIRCRLAMSLFYPILASSALCLSCSELRMNVSAPRSCAFFMRSFSSQRTISRLRCSNVSLQPFISRSICCACSKLLLNSTQPVSGLLTFYDNRSKSTIAIGEEMPSLLFLIVSSKQMGREESNSSTEGSQEESQSKGFSIQQLIIIICEHLKTGGYFFIQIIKNMGNDYICGKEPQPMADYDIQVIPSSSKIESKCELFAVQFLTDVPTITEEMAEAIANQKPFQQQFEQIQKMYIFKLNIAQIYYGQIDNTNLPHGFGKIYKQDGMVQIGQFKVGELIGEHYMFMPNGSYYKGKVLNGNIIEGVYIAQDFKYIGHFQDYQFNGQGKEQHKQYQFQGYYQRGARVQGLLKWKQNNFSNIYRGGFNELGQFHGQGILANREGFFKGNFQNGQRQGFGVFQFTNGLTFHGNYRRGQRNGQGKIINSNQSTCYQGQFKDGLPHGWGKSYDEQGNMTQGQFKFGISAEYYDQIQPQLTK